MPYLPSVFVEVPLVFYLAQPTPVVIINHKVPHAVSPTDHLAEFTIVVLAIERKRNWNVCHWGQGKELIVVKNYLFP